MNSLPTWSLVVTAKAPLVLVKSFVAYHLRLGARELFIFFDDPLDPCFDVVAAIPGVRAFRCDARYWDEQGVARPENHRHRQSINASKAQKLFASDWLAHIDIDEFLHPDVSVAQSLGAAPAVAECVRLNPCENVGIEVPRTYRQAFVGPFRKKLPYDNDGLLAQHLLYGPIGEFIPYGIQGHAQGKIFVRSGSKSYLKIHELVRSEEDLTRNHHPVAGQAPNRVLPAQCTTIQLVHFFALGHADWCGKHLRRLDPTRYATMHAEQRKRWDLFKVAAQRGEAVLSGLYKRMNVLTPAGREALELMDAFIEIDLQLPMHVQACFDNGDHGFDEPLAEMPYAEVMATLARYEKVKVRLVP